MNVKLVGNVVGVAFLLPVIEKTDFQITYNLYDKFLFKCFFL